jgi:hypothetical protein
MGSKADLTETVYHHGDFKPCVNRIIDHALANNSAHGRMVRDG